MAEVKDVLVPDIGDFSDVPIIEVMVSPGDTVAAEDPLVTLESDKATMDVPAPFGGVVQELKVKTGDTVSEGSPLLTLEVGGDGASSDGGGAAEAAAEAGPGVTTPAAEAGAADTVDTAIDAEVAAEVADEPTPPVREPTVAGGDGDGAGPRQAAAAPAAAAPAGDGAASGPVYAGPGARRLARELGVDLATVKGTGRKGRIQNSDVEAAAKRAGAAPEATPAKPAAADGAGLGLLPW